MTARRPNILFVFADQLQAFTLGCMGNPDCHTPNIDRMAREGACFRTAYSATPVCTPFRGTLFSGRYASQTGIDTNGPYFQDGERLLAECLNESGYLTSYVGKWHLGGQGNIAIPPERRAGFTDFIGYQCYNSFRENVWFFDEEEKRHEFDGHRTDVTTDIAIDRLRESGDTPWAMFVSYQNPHYPMQPQDRYMEMYADTTVTLRPNYEEGLDPYTATYNPFTGASPEEDPVKQGYGGEMQEYIRQYYAMVTQLDAQVGRLFSALEEMGEGDDTIVVFTSDHGDMQGCHGERNKGQFWEESAAIPLLVTGPGVGTVAVDQPVCSVDFMPTLLELADAPAENSVEGRSFAPQLRGEPERDDSVAFVEPLKEERLVIRSKRHKLVVDQSTFTPEFLFDLEDDPYELKNLVDSPECEDVRKRLRKRITTWREDMLKRVHPAVARRREGSPEDSSVAPGEEHDWVPIEWGRDEVLELEPRAAWWMRSVYGVDGEAAVGGFTTEFDRLLWEVHLDADMDAEVMIQFRGGNELCEGSLLEVASAPLLGCIVQPMEETVSGAPLDRRLPMQEGRNVVSFRLCRIPGVTEKRDATDTELVLEAVELR